MKKLLKVSGLLFLLSSAISNSMEEQKIEEPIISESQEQDKQELEKLVKEQAEIIEHKDYNYLSDLEDYIQNCIDRFKGKNKKQFAKCLLNALTTKNMLIKIRNFILSEYENHIIDSLFDENILKFAPSKTLKEEVDKNNDSEIEIEEICSSPKLTDLPQEIIAYTLILVIHKFMDEVPTNLIHYSIRTSIKFIKKTTTNVCKKFYLLKGILLNELKRIVHQKLLNEILHIAASKAYNNIAQILINSGKVDIDEMNEVNPLLQTFFNNKKLAKFLLKAGANTEVKDEKGNTPLINSIAAFKLNWVKMLLKYNANCFATNANGCNALEIAEALIHIFPRDMRLEILRLLQEKVLQIEENKRSKKDAIFFLS